jgi:hypothetical protein
LGTVTLDDATPQTPIVASLVNNNNAALEAALNGGIDAANLSPTKIVTPATHLAQGGATTNQVLAWSGSAWVATTLATLMVSAGVGYLLGAVTYNPTVITTANTTSTTGADIDAANLSLTVTLPGTKMLVFQTASADASEAIETFYGIREGTTDIGYAKIEASGTSAGRRTMWYLLTGLVAGVHTYKWAFKANTGGQAEARYGTTASPSDSESGPATMALFGVI